MKVFVINLPEAKERMSFQQAQMTRMGLDYERVEAISGQGVEDAYYKKMYTSDVRILSRNEVACFLSHHKCWVKCVELNQSVAIFEDDSVIDDSFRNIVPEIVNGLADGPFIVNLEVFGTKKRVSKKRFSLKSGAFSIFDIVFAGAGAAGYIISPSAAELCLEKSKRSIGLADIFLFSVRGTILVQVVPAVVAQLGFFGELGSLGKAARTSINIEGSKRASGFESFLANPMTRVRRLRSWFTAIWKRRMQWVGGEHVPVVASDGLAESLIKTRNYSMVELPLPKNSQA